MSIESIRISSFMTRNVKTETGEMNTYNQIMWLSKYTLFT